MSVDPQQLLRELCAMAIEAPHPQHALEVHSPSLNSVTLEY